MKKGAIVAAACLVIVGVGGLVIWIHSRSQTNHIALLHAIEGGDYSSIDDARIVEDLENIMNNRGLREVEWIYYDLNEDGQDELILQEKASVADTRMKRIIGIFAEQRGQVLVIVWDVVDMGAFYYLLNNQLIYTYHYYGIYDYESYTIYDYDLQWDSRLVKGYEYYNIDSMESLPPDWLDVHPDLSQEGTYFRKYTVEDIDGETVRVYQDLTMEQWLDELGFNYVQVLSRREQFRPGSA